MSSLAPPFEGRIAREVVLSWRRILIALLLVVLFIPIRRYKIPGNLPFQLEPYRLFVILIVAGWTASLLVDPRIRVRRSGLEGVLGAILAVTFASLLVNFGRVSSLESTVVKSLMFFLSFFALFYLIVGVVDSEGLIRSL